MKILNTLKKYFENGVINLITSLTTDYSVFRYSDNQYLDEKISDLENMVNTLLKFCQPIKHPSIPASTADMSHLDIYTIGNVCYITGEVYLHFEAAGQHSYNIPDNLAPSSRVRNYAPVIIDGEQYNMHYQIDANSTRLIFYFYDPIPADKAIPINISYNLSTEFLGY